MTVDELRAVMQTEFKNVRAEIKAEAETTRRHFDIMVEKVNDSVKIVAEATAHNTSRLGDHDRRLTALQKSGRR
jgi:hypothetical protein